MIRRNGYTVEIARAFSPGAIPPEVRRSDIVHEVRSFLEARPALRPLEL